MSHRRSCLEVTRVLVSLASSLIEGPVVSNSKSYGGTNPILIARVCHVFHIPPENGLYSSLQQFAIEEGGFDVCSNQFRPRTSINDFCDKQYRTRTYCFTVRTQPFCTSKSDPYSKSSMELESWTGIYLGTGGPDVEEIPSSLRF
ncbi:hypothetical protein Tco_1247593 [Tanacetum coccineum]